MWFIWYNLCMQETLTIPTLSTQEIDAMAKKWFNEFKRNKGFYESQAGVVMAINAFLKTKPKANKAQIRGHIAIGRRLFSHTNEGTKPPRGGRTRSSLN